MAENAAHLTFASSADRPSIFEVIAQESLMLSIRPALKHTLGVLCEIRPERLSWLMQYYDEIYTFLDFILQNHFLHKYYPVHPTSAEVSGREFVQNAWRRALCFFPSVLSYLNGMHSAVGSSFAENFYDLKRIPTKGIHRNRLPRHIYWKSLICLVVLPYIKHKLDKKFEDVRHSINTSRLQTRKLYSAFLGAYPYLHTCWEGAIFAYQLAYMFDKSDCHSPFVQLSGIKLCRNLEPTDSHTEFDTLVWQKAGMNQKLQLLTSEFCRLTGRVLSISLSSGVFFLQFLDWWYAADSEHTSLTALPIPDPPGRYKTFTCPPCSLCPVCHRTRTNDTVLSVSGYVYCYPCIHQFISDHGVCPVTGYRAKTEHLVRLYPPDS